MHSLAHIKRINEIRSFPHRLPSQHAAMARLGRLVCELPVGDAYRRQLHHYLEAYATAFMSMPWETADGEWDALEALQQVTLAESVAAYLRLPSSAQSETVQQKESS